jgi:FkbM family methyltransferase
MDLVGFDYINQKEKELTYKFINDSSVKKYILGINALTKSVLKHIKVDGIIDDFTRVQSSRKKDILNIKDVPKDSIILCTAQGSPLEVQNSLNDMGYTNFSYLSFFRYSNLPLKATDFILDFKDDFINNIDKYKSTYNLLKDKKSKNIFTKILNFKQTFDLSFMDGFTNNFDEQYFDKELIPAINDIVFIDGGAYVGDTLPNIMKFFPTFKKIYAIEPNTLHINIAKRDFLNIKNIEFINCGLGKEKVDLKDNNKTQNNCNHNYQALNINTIDNLIDEKFDFLKLDIEGAEVDTIIGSKNSIKKYHPILAICIYHKASHWYEVPQEVLKIRDDYDIYIRHYMEGIYETVMYFIPRINKKFDTI